jgi:hypothetical protein
MAGASCGMSLRILPSVSPDPDDDWTSRMEFNTESSDHHHMGERGRRVRATVPSTGRAVAPRAGDVAQTRDGGGVSQ